MAKQITAAFVIVGLASVLCAQGASQPRRILFDTFRPLLSRIMPGDREIVVMSAKPMPLVAWPEDDAFVSAIVQENPILLTGRVVDKRPVFLKLLSGQRSSEVPAAQANWIGSRITVLIEGIIQTVDAMPLTLLQRLTYVEEGDGSATVSGVRIDTETPWLDPIQQDRRYLIAGRIKDGAFSSTGMWMEPAAGGPLKPRVREFEARVTPAGAALRAPKSPFDEWTIDEATDSLTVEVKRRRSAR